MDSSSYYQVRQMQERVFHITGYAGEFAYIVQGSKKTLLIDACTGFGNIRDVCGQLTSFPLTVVNTHGHIDHAGGDYFFDEVYIHPKDIPLMNRPDDLQSRLNFLKNQRSEEAAKNVRRGDIAVSRTIMCRPIKEGDTFDLGDRVLEVVELPGHTTGSVGFFDRGNRIFFAGDACNNNTLLFFSHSTSVEEYRKTLKKLKKLQDDFDTYYISHGYCPVDKSCIDDALECCEDILERKDDAVPYGGDRYGDALIAKKREKFRRLDGKFGNIVYSPDKIFDSQMQ